MGLMRQALQVLLCLAACAGTAIAQDSYIPGDTSAFFRGTFPPSPLAGQPFNVVVDASFCEFLSPDRGAAATTLNGTTLTVNIPGLTDGICNFAEERRVYDIPALPTAGRYQVELIFRDIGQSAFDARIGTRTITVVPPGPDIGPAPVIPAGGSFSWLALIVGVVLTAGIALRRTWW